jgi:hypothetical protein
MKISVLAVAATLALGWHVTAACAQSQNSDT